MTTNDEENGAIMGKQPDYSWQSSPRTSNHCSQCGGTGRMKKDAPDPGSLLEWQNKELLRKLGRCHKAMGRALTFLSTCHAPCTRKARELRKILRDAITDRGGASVPTQSD